MLKNKDKRAQYDQERQFRSAFGQGSPFGQGSAYGQGSPFGQGNQYSQGTSRSRSSYRHQNASAHQQRHRAQQQQWQTHGPNPNNPEDFMRWYKTHFGDAFRDFRDVCKIEHFDKSVS